MVKNKFLSFLSLFLALISIFTVFLALPISAAEDTIDLELTTWRFDDRIRTPPWTGSLCSAIGSEVSFISDNITFANMFVGTSSTGTYLSYWELDVFDELLEEVYVFTDLNLTASGYRDITFTIAQSPVPSWFYEWLFANAIKIADHSTELPILSYSIGNDLFQFTDGAYTPSVSMTLTTNSVTFSFGSRSFTWYSESPYYFAGLSTIDNNIPTFVPGQTYQLNDVFNSSSYKQFYPCYSDSPPVIPTYTSSVQVYDRTGAILRYDFTVSADDYAPDLVINFGDLGFEIVEHGRPASSFDLAGSGLITDNFLGFSTIKGASVPSFGSGASISLGGYPMNETLKLYLVYDSLFVDPSDADFTTWIINAVSGFFDFHLWPGLSLNNLVLTVISIGLLYAFLKLTV